MHRMGLNLPIRARAGARAAWTYIILLYVVYIIFIPLRGLAGHCALAAHSELRRGGDGALARARVYSRVECDRWNGIG